MASTPGSGNDADQEHESGAEALYERDDIGRQNFALDASIKRHVYVVVVRFLATTVVALEFGGCGGCIRHAGGHSYDLMLWRVFTGSRCAQLGRGLAYATSRSQK